MSSALRDHVRTQAQLLVHLLRTIDETDSGALRNGAPTGVAESMLRQLEQMHSIAADVGVGLPPVANRDGPRGVSYVELVERIRTRVPDLIERGRVVAVITRGDGALVRLDGVTAKHLPQNQLGVWAGHHPADGRDALEHLMGAYDAGADFLLVPSPSRWWLDYYTELNEYLRAQAVVVADDEDLILFRLPARPSATQRVTDEVYDRQLQQFIQFATMLLPTRAGVCIVTRGDPAWLDMKDQHARHFPGSDDGTYIGHPANDDDAFRHLARAMGCGAQFLAIPAAFSWWERIYPGFCSDVRRRFHCVVSRPELGLIVDLNRPPETSEIQ